ncbi:hypothetical protein EJ05DRAFT_259672 [Pseudovirgaria hyperparasitica]|uniref:Bacteriocin-protection protein, YdeI/OmpD-associated family n=1 Tax=Pseudovirgaria hyperparasitica TaxID=470096 RepID=A0A6A6WGY5_9PEZI|nr:uncharacterized protein EJ05DRAFT_259672 [Pseudovirgaria hyperparasitica]KAF2761320.1 hypothetical protein EJ05DRAFT_259672 [Pseudovirgaria hyperparasitica]
MAEYQIRSFKSASAFRQWLQANNSSIPGIWLQIYKKASKMETVTYADALQEALCFGWIDGQRKSHDATSFIQKFTPRRQRSMWSKRNVDFVEQLIATGRMMPAGLVEVERAKADGRWDASYAGQRDLSVPDEFLNALEGDRDAADFFKTLSRSSRYVIALQLHSAKTAKTRQRRMEKYIAMLREGRGP